MCSQTRAVLFGAVASVLATVASTTVAAAQEPERPGERLLAQQEFRSGVAAAREGRWDDARVAFARAYALVPEPLVLVNLASAEAMTGHLVGAAEHYRRFLREADAPPAADSRSAAQDALTRVEGRIAHVTLRAPRLVRGDTLTLDDAPLSAAVLDRPLPLDPGQHVARATRGAEPVAEAHFSVTEAQGVTIELDVPALPPAPTATPPTALRANATARVGAPDLLASPTQTDRRRQDSEETSSLWASPWLWIAIGAAAIAGGVAIALVATSGGDACGDLGVESCTYLP